MWEEMGWDEKSWDEVRRARMIWDEMKCGVWSASVKCEMRGVKSTVWSVKKVFAWRCIAPGSRADHVLGQQRCNSFAQSTHARAWLAHGACKYYRWERSFSTTGREIYRKIYKCPKKVDLTSQNHKADSSLHTPGAAPKRLPPALPLPDAPKRLEDAEEPQMILKLAPNFWSYFKRRRQPRT